LIDVTGEHDPKHLATTLDSVMSEGLLALEIGSAEMPTLSAVINKIDWATPTWVLPTLPGDTIAVGAAAAYRAAMDGPARIIYADDDLVAERHRQSPHFKPDWNRELFNHWDYISGACVLQVFHSDLEAVADASDWAGRLLARLSTETEPLHLCQMLHHRRSRPAQHIPVTPLNISPFLPPVSVIVPTRNRVDLLRTCLQGVGASEYEKVEIIVVDNDSDDSETLAYLASLDPTKHTVLRHEGAFNYSAINNRAVEIATGRLLCFLNNDIEVSEPHWLATLATQALRPDVGAVGARLLYPDGRIQHAGVVLGIGDAAGHAHRFLYPDDYGYFHRHCLPQFTMAVTAACLVVERDKFLAVGGFDENNFAVAFNDVDLCLRLGQRGWLSFYEPRATLIHHESVSRGFDRDPAGAARLASELAALRRLWKTDQITDPYHHPHLSRASEQFAMAL
jgi:GT2 family glycosyltransferase